MQARFDPPEKHLHHDDVFVLQTASLRAKNTLASNGFRSHQLSVAMESRKSDTPARALGKRRRLAQLARPESALKYDFTSLANSIAFYICD
jgi:hypothetical protein